MMKRLAAVTISIGIAALFGCTEDGGSGGVASTAAPATSPTTSGSAAPAPRTKTATVVARHGEGFLEVDGGRKILHTKGTSYQRGVQYGALVGDMVESVFTTLHAYVRQEAPKLPSWAQQLLTPAGAWVYRPFFDADALEELRGILDGMRLRNPSTPITEADLIFVNSLVDLGATVGLDVFSCSTLAVWGSRTEEGKLFQTRVVDLMVGTGLENHVLTVFAKPEGGVPYVNPGWAGMIGCASGLNAHGLGVGQVWAMSQDVLFGRPWPIAAREILAYGTGVEDAERVLRASARTYGANFVFADRGDARGGQPAAVALESTAHLFASFGPDDPREDQALWNGHPYAIRLPEAVFRGDCSMDQRIRAVQTSSNGPTGDPRAAGAYKNRYEGQADEILAYEAAGVKIGAAECIAITQAVAMKNDSLQCCVYANSDLEVWVANARLENGTKHFAFQEPYHAYSLDYYTPTSRLSAATSAAAPGDAVQATVALDSLGRARGLEVRLALEVGGVRVPVGARPVILAERGATSVTVTGSLPAGVAAGTGELVVEVVEAGSDDLVDLSVAPFDVR